MKKRILASLFAMSLMIIPFQANAGCTSGGPGASSCSATGVTEIMGVSMEVTVSVTCNAGYYACCENSGFTATAYCVASGGGNGPTPTGDDHKE